MAKRVSTRVYTKGHTKTTVTVTNIKRKTKVDKTARKTRQRKGSNGNADQARCPTCGRYM